MRNLYFTVLLFIVGCSKKDIVLPKIVAEKKSDTTVIVTKSTPNLEGYRVAPNARALGTSYWKSGTGVQMDLIIQTFQKVLPYAQIANQHNHIQGGWNAATCGDFNNDGWIDVFTPGASNDISIASKNSGVGFAFLLYDTATKTYKDTSLLNNKYIDVIPDIIKTVPVYLNSDNYVDIVLFPADNPNAKVKLLLSDGKGNYDLFSITTFENDTYGNMSKPTIMTFAGDIGDLNGDNLPDMYLTANNFSYIFWGIAGYPYFTTQNHATFVTDEVNFKSDIQNNGFGETCGSCSGAFGGSIYDVNKDGWNDIIVATTEDQQNQVIPYHNKLLLNKGGGRFNKSSIVNFPFYPKPATAKFHMQNYDYLVDDVNSDGLNDIITLGGSPTSEINFFVYIQNKDGSFYIDNNIFVYNNNNTRYNNDSNEQLLYYDYNKDGKKDIGYIDGNNGSEYGPWYPSTKRGNRMHVKTVFLRTNNQFVETSFYDFDAYAKSLLPILSSRFK